jgi:hypothetical protein
MASVGKVRSKDEQGEAGEKEFKMHKKIIAASLGVIALAAFALAPAVASAVVLTDKTGVVPGNALLRGTNTGILVWTFSGNKIECSTSTMEGAVVENSGTAFKWNVTGASFSGTGTSGDCTSSLGSIKVTTPSLPWCLSSNKTADAFEIRGGKCSEAAKSLTFSMDVTGVATCSYTKSSVAGTFTTAVEKSAFSINEQEFSGAGEGNSFLCPATLQWEWVYEWETNVFPFHAIYVS